MKKLLLFLLLPIAAFGVTAGSGSSLPQRCVSGDTYEFVFPNAPVPFTSLPPQNYTCSPDNHWNLTVSAASGALGVVGTPTATQISAFVDSAHVQATACTYSGATLTCPNFSGDPSETDPGIAIPNNTDRGLSASNGMRLIAGGNLPQFSFDHLSYVLAGISGPFVSESTTTHAVLEGEMGSVINLNNVGASTAQLPAISAYTPNGWALDITNNGVVTDQICATSPSTINGGSAGGCVNLERFVTVQVKSNGVNNYQLLKRSFGSIPAYQVLGNPGGSLDYPVATPVTDAMMSTSVKPSATVVSITNIASLSGAQTIDGVAGTVNQTVVLCMAQTTASQNGPWVMQTSTWTRPLWYPTGGTSQAVQFATIFIRLGTAYAGSVWRLTTAAPITIGTTSTAWAQTGVAITGTPSVGYVPTATGPSTATWQVAPGQYSATDMTSINLRDELTGHSQATSLNIGEMGWGAGAVGTGANTYVAGSFPHIGILNVTSGATASSSMGIFLNNTLTTTGFGALGSNAGWTEVWVFKLSQTTNERLRLGFYDGLVSSFSPTNGIYLRYDTNSGDTNFRFVTRAASTETSTDSTVAADTSWHKVTISSSVSGTIVFQLDSGTPISVSTNVPTVALNAFAVQGNDVTASASILQIDAFAFSATGLSR